MSKCGTVGQEQRGVARVVVNKNVPQNEIGPAYAPAIFLDNGSGGTGPGQGGRQRHLDSACVEAGPESTGRPPAQELRNKIPAVPREALLL